MNSGAKSFEKHSAAGQDKAERDGPALKPPLYSLHEEQTPVPVPATGISALNSKPSLSMKHCSCFPCAPGAEKQKDCLQKGGDDEKTQEATSGSQSLEG